MKFDSVTHHVERAAAAHKAGIDGHPITLAVERIQRADEVGTGADGVAAEVVLAASVGGAPPHDHVEIATALAGAGQVTVREGRLVDQTQITLGSRFEQDRHRTGGADFLVRIQHHLPADLVGPGAAFQGAQRVVGHQNAALEIRHAGSVQLVFGGLSDLLEAAFLGEHGVQMATEKHLQRCLWPMAQPQRRAQFGVAQLAVAGGGLKRGHVDDFRIGLQRRKQITDGLCHAAHAAGMKAAGIDVGQADQLIAGLIGLLGDPLQVRTVDVLHVGVENSLAQKRHSTDLPSKFHGQPLRPSRQR